MNGSGQNEPGLAMSLIGAAHGIEARLEGSLEPLSLSLAKFGVLSALVEAGEPLPLSALAERLSCVRSNITQLVDRLEADKLVARLDDPKDRRSIRAYVTPEGRARHDMGRKALQEAEKAVFARLPRTQREALAGLVRALREAC
jgi:DNA-binding MarR family transcriptional regulator